MPLHRLRILTPTILAIAGMHAAETPTGPAVPKPNETTIVITATRLEIDLFLQPYALHQLDRGGIDEQNNRTMIDAVDRMPGVFMQRTAGNQASPYIRGLTGQQTLLLFDGVRLNNALFRSGPNQYAAMLPDESIDRVDVILGTGTTVLGSDGLTGAIDFRLAKAGRNQNTAASPWVKARHGTAEGDSAATGLDGRVGNWEYSADGSFASFQNTKGGSHAGDRLFGGSANQDTIAHTSYDQYSLGGRTTYLGFTNQRLEFAAGRVQQSSAGRPDGYYENSNVQSAVSRFYDPQTFDYLHLRHVSQDSMCWNRTRTTLWLHRHSETQVREDIQNFTLPTERYRRREFVDAVTTVGIDLQLTNERGPHEITYGATVYSDLISSQYQSYRSPAGNINPASATPFQNDKSNPELTTVPDGSRFTGMAGFAQDFWRINERWNLLSGIRYDAISSSLPITAARPGYATFGNRELKSHADAFTGNIRLAWQASEPVMTWAGIGQGFRTPTASDLAGTQDRASSSSGAGNGPQTEGNPDLQPEQSLTFEWGTRFQHNEDSASLALFHTRLQDLITTRYIDVDGDGVISNLPPATNPDRAIRDNASRAVLQGGEVACDISLPITLSRNWRLSFFQSTSFVDGEALIPQVSGYSGSEHISRANTLTGKLGLKLAEAGSWHVLTQVRWAAAYDEPAPSDASDVRMTIAGDGTGRMPGWAVWDIKAGIMGAPDTWRVDVGAENIGNITYRQTGSGADGAGLNVIASGQVRF
ncbi:MAG: TonB-dependent receptor [Planctomycetota bacterium]